MMIPDKRGEKYMAVEPDDAAEATLKQPRFDELKKYPLGHNSGVYSQISRTSPRARDPTPPRWA